MPKLTLAAEFPERSQADWEALAAKGLQGAPLSSLASETLDGIPIEPIYAVAGLSGALAGLVPGEAPFVRGNRKVISRFDEFAHDLHDFFATGSRVEMGAKQARK